jgi:hypothetical protein
MLRAFLLVLALCLPAWASKTQTRADTTYWDSSQVIRGAVQIDFSDNPSSTDSKIKGLDTLGVNVLSWTGMRDSVGAVVADSAAEAWGRDSTITAVTDTFAVVAIPFSDGTSALPAITNLGDLNTGVYFPAADQVGISAGGGLDLLVSGDDITVRDDVNVGDDVVMAQTSALNWGGDMSVTGGADQLTFAGGNLRINGSLAFDYAPSANIRFYVVPTMAGQSDQAGNFSPNFTYGATANNTGLSVGSGQASGGNTLTQISARGSVSSGTTSTHYGLRVLDPYGAGAITTNYAIFIDAQTKGSANYAAYFGGGIVNMQQLTASQTVITDGSKNLSTSSDMNMKRDYGLIQSGTEIVLGLKPRYWDWKTDAVGDYEDTRFADYIERKALMDRQPRLAGYFAQEVHAVFPEGAPGGANIDKDGNEHWGLNLASISAATVAALQEQIARIDSLEGEIRSQDVVIVDLLKRVKALEKR